MSHVVLVLGMHRSGTSVITKSTECFGVSLGDRAEWYGPDNVFGFWEDLDILGLDDMLLKATFSDWDKPLTDEAWDFMPSARANAVGMLGAKLHRWPLFGLKEPRMCRLLPFWRPVFETLGCEVSVVHVIRHPTAVAKSLAKRNGMSMERAYALWLDHVTRQYADCDPAWKQVTVDYQDFMLFPKTLLYAMTLHLGLTVLNGDIRAVEEFCRRSVKPELRHHEPDDSKLPLEVNVAWKMARERVI